MRYKDCANSLLSANTALTVTLPCVGVVTFAPMSVMVGGIKSEVSMSRTSVFSTKAKLYVVSLQTRFPPTLKVPNTESELVFTVTFSLNDDAYPASA